MKRNSRRMLYLPLKGEEKGMRLHRLNKHTYASSEGKCYIGKGFIPSNAGSILELEDATRRKDEK